MKNLTRRPAWRAAAVGLAGTLAVGGAVGIASQAGAVEGFAFERLQGQNRYETAAAIATSSFSSASRVVLASGETRNFPDALTGNYLAGFAAGPIVLTETSRLPAPSLKALRDLQAQRVTIVGGPAAVSEDVARSLRSNGFTVDRIFGQDRYETAQKVGGSIPNSYVGEVGGLRTAFLGSGQNFPDILASSPASFEAQLPITITRPESLPAETEAELRDLAIEQVIIVGGPDAVSTAVENRVDQIVDRVRRIQGTGRYETARAIADFALSELGFGNTHVNLARGDQFPDALAGGPHAGRDRAPILLTPPNVLANATEAFLEQHDCTLRAGHIFGGTAAVNQSVENRAEEVAGSCEGQPSPTTSPSPSPTDTPTSGISVTPDTSDTRTVTMNPDTTGDDDRGFQIAGLVSGETYRITLVRCENVRGSGESATFLGEADPASGTGVSAATGSPTADIITVNGQNRADADPSTGFQSGTTTFVASGTTATFVIDGDSRDECVVPVVYFDASTRNTAEGGSSPRLELQGQPGQFSEPVEEFDTGGRTNFVSTGSATVRPELLTAEVLETGSSGTTVAYTFDETVALGDLAQFQIYNANGTLADAEGETAAVSGSTVTVRFAGVTTSTGAGRLTVATVDVGAVRDSEGRANPEGDAALGEVQSVDQPGGITTAPDLLSVGNFRPGRPAEPGATPTTTAVDFTFDEVAHLVAPGGFALIRNDGEDFRGTPISDTASTTITVEFQNRNVNAVTNPTGDPFTSANVARGTVDDATVSDERQIANNPDPDNPLSSDPVEGNANPLQAAEVGNAGNTSLPDLVSVDLRPNPNTVQPDFALFLFDEPVEAAAAGNFRLYKTDATFVSGNSAAIQEDARQVLVRFPQADATVNAVGGNVLDDAVFQSSLGDPRFPTNEGGNEQDEVAIVDTPANDQEIPGRTEAPDLDSVQLSTSSDVFRATYFFDEPVQRDGPVAAKFALYQPDGVRLIATSCATGTTTSGSSQNNNTVTCTAYVLDNNNNGVVDANEPQASSAQIGNATLGTVDNGAVLALSDAAANPEGAEFTTGGTGARTS